MIEEIKDFKRKKIFDHYHEGDNPFVFITTKIDVTNVVKYCNKHKNFYATFGYIVTKTTNEIENFKYRYKDGKFYYCDKIRSNYTQMYKDETIGYFTLPVIDDFNEYIKNFNEVQEKFLEDKEYKAENDIDVIWISCEPWFSFSSIVPIFNKKKTIPQFIWDKYKLENDKYFMNIMIMIHHGFADGIHIARFIEKLEKNIKSF